MKKKSDSVVLVCRQLIKSDKQIARKYHLRYELSMAAFDSKDYELAVHQARKLIPKIYLKSQAHWNRQCFVKNIRCKTLCSELANYYDQTGNLKTEYKYLSLMIRKFNSAYCGTQRHVWNRTVYTRMIDCSTQLGKTQRAKRLKKKLEESEK